MPKRDKLSFFFIDPSPSMEYVEEIENLFQVRPVRKYMLRFPFVNAYFRVSGEVSPPFPALSSVSNH